MDPAALRTAADVMTAIVLEAAPFLLLGSLCSALLATFAADRVFLRLAGKKRPAQVALGLVAGLAMPTCECGAAPLARRLLRKGAPAGAVIPFMLAGPVLNPAALAATWTAFRGDWRMAAWRALLVMLPAAAMGVLLSAGRDANILRPDREGAASEGCACCSGRAHAPGSNAAGLLLDVLRRTGREFLDMGRFLILGAAAAALCKTFLPQAWLLNLSTNLWLSVPAMLLLAVLMSICSSADAFVAASLPMIPQPALLAFLALGPMLDLKLAPAYLGIFRARPARLLIVAPAAMVFILCMGLGLAGALE